MCTLPPPIPEDESIRPVTVPPVPEAPAEPCLSPEPRCATQPRCAAEPRCSAEPHYAAANDYADAMMPPTYFGWLLVCVLLCVVTAVAGLVFASRVSQRWRMGDVEGARRASADARLMLLASVVLGLINVPFMMLYFALT